MMTAYRHCSCFDGNRVVCLGCYEDLVLCVGLQHDLSGELSITFIGVVVYILIYSQRRIV